jgi:hypothetical protein
MRRRNLLRVSAFAALVGSKARRPAGAAETFPPTRQLTKGPRFHWFGYYDKLQFSTDDRLVLCNQAEFENRSPKPDDVVNVGMIDLHDKDRWIPIGTSRAWCWQQGCMLQWLPGSETEAIWNDRDGDRFVSRILDTKTGKKRTVPHPVYAVAPDGAWAIAPDFSRLNDMRPGYGYAGAPDAFASESAPEKIGITRVDLKSGASKLLFSLAEIAAKFPFEAEEPARVKHWFNHLLVNPTGTRFVFLHRWRTPEKGHLTHMITADPDGSNVRLLIGSGFVSHFIWKDDRTILAYAKPKKDMPWGFFEFVDDGSCQFTEIGRGVLVGDGHCTYLPGNRWILNDTYRDKNKIQHPHLFDTQTGRRVELGEMHLPDPYVTGSRFNEWRVDLHPRFSRSGKFVTIDSPYTGQGRQLHMIDISDIVGG